MVLADALLTSLRAAKARYDELTEQLSAPDVIGEGKKVTAILRQRGALEKKAKLCERCEAIERRRADAGSP